MCRDGSCFPTTKMKVPRAGKPERLKTPADAQTLTQECEGSADSKIQPLPPRCNIVLFDIWFMGTCTLLTGTTNYSGGDC